jgi:uncharacterized protein YbaP (TraB family)
LKAVFFLVFLFSLHNAVSGQSSVWKISENGNTVYLAASIHLLREKDYPLPGEFDAAFDASEILVIETDVDEMNASAAYLDLMRPGDGETLRTRLSQRTYSLLEKKAAELSLPMEFIRPLRPSVALMIFSARVYLELGFIRPGVDLYYLAKAKEESRTLMYLENVEAHLAALFAGDDDTEDEYVFSSLKELDNSGPELIQIIAEWRSGTGDITEEIVRQMAEQHPHIYQAMILNRNRAWLPLIKSFLASPETEFVIAGAAHFYGPDGLLALLAADGYTAVQMRLEEF